MSRTMLMVGHPQGAVDRDLGRRPHRVGLDRAALPDGGGLLRPRRLAAAARLACSRVPRRAGSARRCGAPTTSARRGRRPQRCDPLPRGHRTTTLARVWQLGPRPTSRTASSGRAPSRARSSGRRPWRDASSWSAACGTTRTAPSGTRASAARRSTRSCRTPPTRRRVLAALSTGGVYVTEDGGTSWKASNTGVKAEFLPGERNYPEFGQCVHKVARDAADPDRLYLQNHGGVYRSDDGGDVLAGHRPGAADGVRLRHGDPPAARGHGVQLPDHGADARWPVDGKARVCRTTDAGSSWEPLGEGILPDGYYTAVMRDALCADDHEQPGLYFGGRNGACLGLARRGGVVAGDPQGPAGRAGAPCRADLT